MFAKSIMIIAALLLSAASAHLCLLSPTQRGGPVDVNKQANPSCALAPVFGKNGPCGDVEAARPSAFLAGGQRFVGQAFPCWL
jgi:hypothetical protein